MTRLHPSGFHSRILYELPKIHKINVPLRPILSCSGCHNLKRKLKLYVFK